MRRLITHRAWIRTCVLLSALGGIVSIEGTALSQQTRRPAASSRKSLPAEAQGQMKQAMSFFRANKYKEASAIFSRLLRTHPDNEMARIYLGKSLFRMDRVEESYQVFRTLNLKTMDAETSFEYGKSYFDREQYEEALNAMQQVPEGHDYYDLAAYYGAISAMKLKRYRDAERMIENAVVLPSKLMRSRNLYKQHIHQIIVKEQEELLSREKAAEEKRLKDQTRVFREKLNDSSAAKISAKDLLETTGEPTHDGFYGTSRSTEAGFRISDQFVDFNRIESNTNRHHTNFFMFQNGAHKILSRREKTSTSALGVGVKLSIWDRNYHQAEIPLQNTNDERMLFRVFESGPEGNQKLGLAAFNAWYERSIASSLWVGTRLSYFGGYPDFKSKDSIANRDAEFRIGRKRSNTQSSFAMNYIQTIDGSGRILTETAQGTIAGAWSLPQSLGVEGSLRAQMLRYPRKFVEGPSKTVRGQGNIYSDFPYGARLGVEGYYQINQNYKKISLPTFSWDQTDVYGALYMLIKPFNWLAFDIRGARLQRVFSTVKPDGDDNSLTLEKGYPNFVAETSASVMLNLLF